MLIKIQCLGRKGYFFKVWILIWTSSHRTQRFLSSGEEGPWGTGPCPVWSLSWHYSAPFPGRTGHSSFSSLINSIYICVYHKIPFIAIYMCTLYCYIMHTVLGGYIQYIWEDIYNNYTVSILNSGIMFYSLWYLGPNTYWVLPQHSLEQCEKDIHFVLKGFTT